MRSCEENIRQLRSAIGLEAERKGFPECAVDFEDNGYVMRWGPGISGWIDVLSRADFKDLIKIRDALLQIPRSPDVPAASLVRDIVDALVQSARLWAHTTLDQAIPNGEFATVVKTGCPVIVDSILRRHHDALITFWCDTYADAMDR